MAIKIKWEDWDFGEFINQYEDKDSELRERVNKYFKGNHFQDGKAWIGPIVPVDHPDHRAMLGAIKKGFISANKIAEITNRKLSAMVGNVFSLEVFDSDLTEEQIAQGLGIGDKAKTLLKSWWNDEEKNVDKEFKKAATDLILHGKLAVRTFVPYLRLNEAGGITVNQDVHHNFFVEALPIGDVHEYLDAASMVKYISYRYSDEDTGKDYVEVYWVNPDTRLTEMRIYEKGKDEPVIHRFDYGGMLPIKLITDTALITEQIIQNQNALNVALTMTERNQELAGFLERYFLNADEPTELTETGEIVKKGLRVGAATATFLEGVRTVDDMGKESISNPSVFIKDPVDTAKLRAGIEIFKTNILDEARQLHALNADNVNMSEDSRRQAMSDFESSVNDTAMLLSGLGSWIAKLFLTMMKVYGSSEYSKFDTLRVAFTLNVEVGVLPASFIQIGMEAVDKKFISVKTFQLLFGIKDTEAENKQIAKEAAKSVALQAELLEQYDLEPLPDNTEVELEAGGTELEAVQEGE